MVKGLISKLKRTNVTQNQQQNKLIFKTARGTEQTFSIEEIQMANRYRKRCSTSLIIREMQVKIMMRYHHHTLVRMAVIKNTRSRHTHTQTYTHTHTNTCIHTCPGTKLKVREEC